ncbi:hypothetical protein L0128_12450 [candidate division KSB1 bacterium]|nr:hypothetical protein [candidate division KSB1 bacterium]
MRTESRTPQSIELPVVFLSGQAITRQNYRKNVEIAIICSLIIFIILILLFPENKKNQKLQLSMTDNLDLVAIPLMEEELPPLPPLPALSAPEQMIAAEIQVITETDTQEVAPTLDLKLEIAETKVLDSQLDDNFKIQYDNYRKLQLAHNKLDLSDNMRFDALQASDLKLESRHAGRDLSGANEKVDLKLDNKTDVPASGPEETAQSSTTIIETTGAEDVVILKPPRSTLALNEYRLWSKLAGELDRLDKREFSQSIPNFRKTSDGILINFNYQDGIQHEIIWKKGGKTAIKVIGKNRKNSQDELQRALSAILQMTLKF